MIVAIMGIVMVTVGGIMTMSFKSKNRTESNEAMSARAVYILSELKRNVLEAKLGTITCPTGVGDSISFTGKSGGNTTLLCDETTAKIASVSATGAFEYLGDGVRAINCQNFVSCVQNGETVETVNFTINLATGESLGMGVTGVFYGAAAPRD